MSFQKIFDMQLEFQQKLGYDFDKMSISEKEQYTKDTILYLLEEVHELLREINFKTYKKVKKPISRENIKEELVDILHFYLNLIHVWNVSSDELIEAFKKKHAKNHERVENPEY